MDLIILNAQTQEQIDTCKAKDWLVAVQYVEKHKDKYLKSGCLEVHITSDEGTCKWELTEEKRPHILNDKIHPQSARRKRKRTF